MENDGYPSRTMGVIGLVGAACLYAFNLVVALLIALRDIHRPTRAMTWLMLSILIPLGGIVVYILVSRPLGVRRPLGPIPLSGDGLDSAMLDTFSPSTKTIYRTLFRASGETVESGSVTILSEGSAKYDALLDALQSARTRIHVEYYIFRDDSVGRRVLEVLEHQAQNGVHVRLLLDGFGSRQFPKASLQRLHIAGVECRVFFPLRFPWLTRTINHRDHCKIVTVDGNVGFVGGMNVGEEYVTQPCTGYLWRDTHLRVEGRCVNRLDRLFAANWAVATPYRGSVPGLGIRSVDQNAGTVGESVAGSLNHPPAFTGDMSITERSFMQLIQSGPDEAIQQSRVVFFTCLTQARKTIDLATPYFVPESDITMAMKSAILRGVEIRLLIPGRSDHLLVSLASRTYYRELLDAGVRIFAYEAGLFHAKVMIVDGEVSVVGAANCDMRSFRLNYEVCEVVYDRAVASQLTDQFECDLHHATELHVLSLKDQGPFEDLLERAARLLAPLL